MKKTRWTRERQGQKPAFPGVALPKRGMARLMCSSVLEENVGAGTAPKEL